MNSFTTFKSETENKPDFVAQFFAECPAPGRYTVLALGEGVNPAKIRHDISGAVGRLATLVDLLEGGFQLDGEQGEQVILALKKSVATLEVAVQPVTDALR